MQFIRRPDLDPQTRIHIVMLAWLHQGLYGKMTEIANSYRISRTFLYQLLLMATLQLETLFKLVDINFLYLLHFKSNGVVRAKTLQDVFYGLEQTLQRHISRKRYPVVLHKAPQYLNEI